MESINAVQSDPNSWIARTEETIVFTALIDHVDKVNNRYSHHDGIYHKAVPPTPAGNSALAIKHSRELFDAVSQAFSTELRCNLVLVKGTKHGVSKGGVRAAVDGDLWVVQHYAGSVDEGFAFDLSRVY